MTEVGEAMIAGAQEALKVARGEEPAARIHQQGHTYVPIGELNDALTENQRLMKRVREMEADALRKERLADRGLRENHDGSFTAIPTLKPALGGVDSTSYNDIVRRLEAVERILVEGKK